MYRYSISKEDVWRCAENYLNSRFRKIDIFATIIFLILMVVLWCLILIFSQYIQSNFSEEDWMKKLIPGGNIVYFYCGLSILGIISCVVQRKKFDKNK